MTTHTPADATGLDARLREPWMVQTSWPDWSPETLPPLEDRPLRGVRLPAEHAVPALPQPHRGPRPLPAQPDHRTPAGRERDHPGPRASG
jgi:hypothetical protein